MTPFALLETLAGLSHREAAEFHRVRLDTVKSWAVGRNACPARVIAELRALIASQERAATESIAQIAALAAQESAPDGIELGYPTDDAEARSLGVAGTPGWPCVGAWRALAARVVAGSSIPVVLVPRGSTPATAAAADAHDKILRASKTAF